MAIACSLPGSLYCRPVSAGHRRGSRAAFRAGPPGPTAVEGEMRAWNERGARSHGTSRESRSDSRTKACLLLLGTILLAGCGGGKGGAPRYVDKLPLPPDTMRVAMDEVGRYGGRFVAGSTASPKTFNPMMANETNSNEVVQQLFISLT